MTAEQASPPDAEDPKKTRIKKAIRTNMRNKEERMAKELVERGWTVISPYDHSIRGPKST